MKVYDFQNLVFHFLLKVFSGLKLSKNENTNSALFSELLKIDVIIFVKINIIKNEYCELDFTHEMPNISRAFYGIGQFVGVIDTQSTPQQLVKYYQPTIVLTSAAQ